MQYQSTLNKAKSIYPSKYNTDWGRERITIYYFCLWLNNTTKSIPECQRAVARRSGGPQALSIWLWKYPCCCHLTPFSANVSSVLLMWIPSAKWQHFFTSISIPSNDELTLIYRALCPRKLGFPCTRVSNLSLTAKETLKQYSKTLKIPAQGPKYVFYSERATLVHRNRQISGSSRVAHIEPARVHKSHGEKCLCDPENWAELPVIYL